MNETLKCKSCGQPMIKICATGVTTQLGEYRQDPASQYKIWHQTGLKTIMLYQCPEDKTIAVD